MIDNVKYWEKYYNNMKNVNDNNLHKNVGRTKNGIVISDSIWKNTLQYIKNNINIKKEDVILELACGNGQVLGYLSRFCKLAYGVDFSQELLSQFQKTFNKKNIKLIYDNILKVNFENNYFNSIIIYFSIQHFSEKQVITIVANSLRWLKKGSVLFIGDIPDEEKKWEFINKPEYKRDYIERVLCDKPMIGYWFNKEFFIALQYYFKNIEVRIINQPYYQINSEYRFDVLIKKNYD